jgi:hypothetical protein
MSDQGLRFSYWLVSSRSLLQKALIGVCIAIDAALLLLAVVLAAQFALAGSHHRALLASYAENRVHYSAINARIKPPALAVTQSAVLGGAGGKYDLVAIVRNTSNRWAVESATGAFTLDAQDLGSDTISLFPGEERYLAVFGVSLPRVSPQMAPSVQFSQIRWRKALGPGDLPDIQLDTINPTYRLLSSAPTAPLSQVTGAVLNRSVVLLPEVEVTTLLFHATSIVGVGRLTLSRVAPLEERPVDIRFSQALSVDTATLKATVDLAAYEPSF